ncbi:MAG: metallophosphoesterase [Methanomassiliicoccales archaeon]|jgi:putative SbcD/Mre11-related phosphoesterase
MKELEVMPGLFISNELCAFLPHQSTVVVSDLHIGYESVLEDSGLHLPRIQTARMMEDLERIVELRSPARFIILGDLKHEFSRNLSQEWDEVRRLLAVLQEKAEVVVIRGNHDNYLATIASKLGVEIVNEYHLAGMTFAHGHEPCEERPLVIGHEHPSVRLCDDVGGFVKVPCFMHLPMEQILVMPAFSPLAPGTDLTGATSAETFSPVLQSSDMGDATAYACTDIGLLSLGPLSKLSRRRPSA